MKRRFALIFTLLVFLFSISVCAEAQLYHITDESGLLSDSEWTELETTAQQLEARYDVGLYVIVVDDYTEYTTEASSIYESAKTFYNYYTLGAGQERSGVLLLLSMEERDYALISYGYGSIAFTDYGKDYLSEEFLDHFKKDDWCGGFSDYLSVGGEMLEYATKGSPVDEWCDPRVEGNITAPFFGTIVFALLGLGVALIVQAILMGKMRSVALQTHADAYAADRLQLTGQSDQFINMTTTRVYEEPKSSRSGGSSVDSDGFSGKSGKF